VNHVVATIKKQLAAARDNPEEPSRVFVISTYVIGKERILLAVRRLCFCAARRRGQSGSSAPLVSYAVDPHARCVTTTVGSWLYITWLRERICHCPE